MFNYKNYLLAMKQLNVPERNAKFLEVCISGELEKVNLLLENKKLKVDMYFKDNDGKDCFFWACVFNHKEVIRELLIKYEYNISERNLNYIMKRNNELDGGLGDIVKMIQSKELNDSLHKDLEMNGVKPKKQKL